MFRNYIKIAVRNLWKHKDYSFINIVGLAIGMAVSMLILMFVTHEYSYDKFHKNADRIYGILAKVSMDGREMQFKNFNARLGPALKEATPGIEEVVRIKTAYDKVLFKNPETADGSFYEQNFMFTDASFFKVFSFKIKAAKDEDMIVRPYTMVISERVASKYFGDVNPLGKTMLYEGKHLFEITSIAENPPSNSTFNFDFVASIETIPQLSKQDKEMWEHAGAFNTYLLLNSDKSVSQVEKNIISTGNKVSDFDAKAKYLLEKFTSTHLENNFAESGNTRLIKIFAGIAMLILFLALFNYMSLTTARSTLRTKEVGVRKVAGAGRNILVKQFYTESVLVCLIAFLLSFVLMEVMRQPFYNLLGLRIDPSFLISKSFLAVLAAVLLFSAFVSGSYPALILSGFSPMDVLKGRLGSQQRGATVRKVFMVFQFTVSITLIVCSVVVKQQLTFMQNKKLGLNKEQVLAISLTGSVGKNYFSLKNDITGLSGVQNVTFSSTGLYKGYSMFFAQNKATNKDVSVAYAEVDANYMNTFDLKWAIKPQGTSWKNGHGMLLSEAAVKDLGLQGNPIGQMVFNKSVAGVLKDFNFTSTQEEKNPMGLIILGDTTNLLSDGRSTGILYTRLDPKADIVGKVRSVEAVYKKYSGDKPFEYYFLDEAFNDTFKTEIRMAKMFTVFTAFAIFIACMGLFGLVTFTAETRTKEIGIRKVLGASVTGVVALLSQDFFKLVLLSILLATPIAWYVMHQWLQDFVNRIDIAWWVFALAGVLSLFITLLTVSFQSIKAAMTNPAKSLKAN